MSTDDRKAPTPAPRTDKQDSKLADLPKTTQADKDDQVKGGRMKLDPKQ